MPKYEQKTRVKWQADGLERRDFIEGDAAESVPLSPNVGNKRKTPVHENGFGVAVLKRVMVMEKKRTRV